MAPLPSEEKSEAAAMRRRQRAELPTPNSTHSYWHRDPSKKLLGHRTTEDLPSTADVVVIGSGICGAFAARELVAGGRSVVMLEAREACWGATGRVKWRPLSTRGMEQHGRNRQVRARHIQHDQRPRSRARRPVRLERRRRDPCYLLGGRPGGRKAADQASAEAPRSQGQGLLDHGPS
ncbi:hypothetical protein NPX13_g7821 [Xylaria arbuscula]|uniref:FAD dependent oxidoreductase domain-containing protein n=1 Tax=Xylaria arbuscula TaxID=114810 RepID=A0A9W8N9U1_9PEZI|nr:hypothetical protein NPX13_g7821 [Xylaria arbuscula]